MTDNEIIKALDCCANCESCDFEITNCPLVEEMECRSLLAQKALDLITRQQSEIERLQNILMCFMGALGKVRKIDDIDEISLIPLMSELNKQYRAELKAQAYKEFADRLKELDGYYNHNFDDCVNLLVSDEYIRGRYEKINEIWSTIDNLLKEMEDNNNDR